MYRYIKQQVNNQLSLTQSHILGYSTQVSLSISMPAGLGGIPGMQWLVPNKGVQK